MKNRKEIQNIALERAKDADILFNNGQYSGSYYLSGYVVECGLKACFAKTIQSDDFPDKDKIIKAYTHDINKLIEHAGLSGVLKKDRANNKTLDKNWSIAAKWNEECRYLIMNQVDAQDMYNAVFSQNDGVFSRLKSHW